MARPRRLGSALLRLLPGLALPVPATAAPPQGERFTTNRESPVELPLPVEDEAFVFAVFGDRTGGPPEGVQVLAQAVEEVNLIEPDLVMTVGDLIQGYNETPEWLAEMREYRGIMERLACPWFPVAGNHDVYWRGEGDPPPGEHEGNYEAHFGPLWYAFRHKAAWFIVLYSDEGDPATGERSYQDPAAQRMSPEQLEWLAGTLEQAKDARHVFVFLHHPRWLGGGYGDDWERVHALLAGAGNVSAVFAGHIHRMRYDGPRDGIEYFTLATVGGGQSGAAPEAGYLHQYHLVTVREDRVAVAAFPVGSAFDPRAVTGEVSDDARAVAEELSPAWTQPAALSADGRVEALVRGALENPVDRPLDVTVHFESRDSRWRCRPDHHHLSLAGGERASFATRVLRPAGSLDDSFRELSARLSVDYQGEGARISLPDRSSPVALDVTALPPLPRPSGERVLVLDGVDDYVRVEHDALDVPDGPLTLECWVKADALRESQALVAKTESSEYGLFASAGKPGFYVHLDGAYASAEAPEPVLAPGRWHHVAGVFDGSRVQLFVDGRPLAEAPASGARTVRPVPLFVGADVRGDGSATWHFPGSIDEVRLSTTARYAAPFDPVRRHESDGETALLLSMDGARGPWVLDASPHRAHGTLRGGAGVQPE